MALNNLTPPPHTSTVQETERLLESIGQNRGHLDTFFPRAGYVPTDEEIERHAAGICFLLLIGSDWLKWMKKNGWVERGSDGGLRPVGSWSGYQDPVPVRLRQLAQVFEQCDTNVGGALSKRIDDPHPEWTRNMNHYRRSPKTAWLFTYASLKRRGSEPSKATETKTPRTTSGLAESHRSRSHAEARSVPTSSTVGSPLTRSIRYSEIPVIDPVTDSESDGLSDGDDLTDGSLIVELPITSPLRKRQRQQQRQRDHSPISIRSTPSPPPVSLYPLKRPAIVIQAPPCTPARHPPIIPFHRRPARDQDQESEPTDSDSDSDLQLEPRRPAYTRTELGQFITLTTDDQLDSMFMDETLRPHHHWRIPPSS